jgi:hypothetical protein
MAHASKRTRSTPPCRKTAACELVKAVTNLNTASTSRSAQFSLFVFCALSGGLAQLVER